MAVGVSGGAKAQAHLARIAAKVATLPHVRVGFLEKATYPNTKSVAMVAAIQNFGAPRVGIPPRPFFSNMIAANRADWGPAIGRILKLNNYDTEKSLRLLGEAMVGQLRQAIKDLHTPPLGPVTLMLRRMRKDNPQLVVNWTVVQQARARVKAGKPYSGVSIKPLIYSGMLFNSADYEVRK